MLLFFVELCYLYMLPKSLIIFPATSLIAIYVIKAEANHKNLKLVGYTRLEPVALPLSGVRSNHLS